MNKFSNDFFKLLHFWFLEVFDVVGTILFDFNTEKGIKQNRGREAFYAIIAVAVFIIMALYSSFDNFIKLYIYILPHYKSSWWFQKSI